MQELNTISSSQYATEQATAINQNFAALKTAVEGIDGGGGGSAESIRTYINNLPSQWMYDSQKTTLKVLAIGNSFLLYPLVAFGVVINLSGASSSVYCLQHEGSTGTSLQTTLSMIKNNSAGASFAHKIYGDGGISSYYYRTALINDWDAIIFQQNSDNVTDYSTYNPYLAALVDAAKNYCTNPKVKVGWHMIWDKYHGTDSTQRANILLNSKRVMDDCGIDFIVPTGTAYENGWANGLSLMLDPSGHPNNSVAEYLASCCWYQTLFSLFLGKDIVTDMTPSTSLSWTSATGAARSIDVATATQAAKCAKAAVVDMWNTTIIS